jgi:hypothetical protein
VDETLLRQLTFYHATIKLTQALHSVLGPIGPLLHSGVSVAPHPRHFGVFLSPFPLCVDLLLEFEDEVGLSGTDDGSGLGGSGLACGGI